MQDQARQIVEDLHVRAEHDTPLGPRTWYGVGGNAQVLAHPSSTAQLAALVSKCRQHNTPVRILGSGANLLVRDQGVPGLVVMLDDPAFTRMHIEGESLVVGGGYDLFKLVRETARAGLGGLEHVAGIPASIGGAVRMNAGGAFGEIGSSVSRVQVMSDTGQVYYRNRDDLVFSYRRSNITAPFIIEIEFDMDRREPTDLMRQVKEIFFYKKNTQPMGEPTAGCVFKNPPTDAALSPSPSPSPPDPVAQPVVSAGPVSAKPTTAAKLIDEAGLKGTRHGSAYVSHIHANFIAVDRHHGKADDLWHLIQHVEQTVAEHFGIHLTRELTVWP